MGVSDPNAAVAAVVDTYRNLIEAAAQRHVLDPSMLYAIIHDESGGNPDAYRVEGKVGDVSVGLMQVLVGTARELGYGGPVRSLFDPTTNIELGSQYLAQLIRKYTNPWLALVAYNGGPKAVRLYYLGFRRTPAVGYANRVWTLTMYYQRREAAFHGPGR